ncbi:MAG: peptide ligase PGM1-related protein [Gemmatimonadaceae bacterium]
MPPRTLGDACPSPGSLEERGEFARLQQRLAPLFEQVFSDPRAERTIVVVPSMSLPRAELAKLSGANHYEERLLCMLMLLRFPRASLVYVTSEPVAPSIIDYYLHLLPGIPASHARRRLTVVSCDDGTPGILSEKLLARPDLLARIRAAIPDRDTAHLTCFNVTPLERTIAVRLGIPLYGCDPDLSDLGTKSGSRELFRRVGVPLPPGFEHLRDARDIAHALVALKRDDPALRRAVVKLNDGFSGDGNAVFSFQDAPGRGSLTRWVHAQLPSRLRFEDGTETWEAYAAKFKAMGGVTECFLEGAEVRSPSVQCRVDPLGHVSVISSHDQLLGGPSGQVYHGCTFPANEAYCQDIQQAGLRVSAELASAGVLGRFGIDFVSVRRADGWESYAIEVNLRKGGTTHPFLMLQFLTDGVYDADRGAYHTRTGRPCFYHATDNLTSPAFVGLHPDDLIDIAVTNGLHFDAATQQGVMFHLLGALPAYGKLGALCVGDSRESAEHWHRAVLDVLGREAQRRTPMHATA